MAAASVGRGRRSERRERRVRIDQLQGLSIGVTLHHSSPILLASDDDGDGAEGVRGAGAFQASCGSGSGGTDAREMRFGPAEEEEEEEEEGGGGSGGAAAAAAA